MKTLFVSDLDGTLLNSKEEISDYTKEVINDLIRSKDMLFSYATARSFHTAHKVTSELEENIPAIVYNGAFIINKETREMIYSNYFLEDEIIHIKKCLKEACLQPIVYSFMNDKERFTYMKEKVSIGANKFIVSRKGDERSHPITDSTLLYQGHIFYFTCIDAKDILLPVYEQLKHKYHCIFHEDIYTKEYWLEILPCEATKANAISKLKELMHCDKVVCFGDGKNDITMFNMADACYAVGNAVTELKEIATGIIDCNNNDGVAKWLKEYHNSKD